MSGGGASDLMAEVVFGCIECGAAVGSLGVALVSARTRLDSGRYFCKNRDCSRYGLITMVYDVIQLKGESEGDGND